MKQKIKSLVVCASLCILYGCAKNIELQKQTFTFELGKDVYANPALYVKDGEDLPTQNMKITSLSRGVVKKENRFMSQGKDYLVVGEYDFQIENGSSKIPFKIKIKDTMPPTATEAPTEYTTTIGSVINWDEVFHATDLSGVRYETSAAITSGAGEKEVVVKIMDRYGNTLEMPIKVIVNA